MPFEGCKLVASECCLSESCTVMVKSVRDPVHSFTVNYGEPRQSVGSTKALCNR